MSESTWKTLANVKETAEAVSESAAAVELLCYKTAAASLFYKRPVKVAEWRMTIKRSYLPRFGHFLTLVSSEEEAVN